MERGFHGFFRQYYNLRALLRRVDPQLAQLTPLADYPVLGPGRRGAELLATRARPAPLQIAPSSRWRTPYLRLVDLPRIDGALALADARLRPERTYAALRRHERRRATSTRSASRSARGACCSMSSRTRSSTPRRELSAAELLMMFHFYFTGNPEGLVFDVARRPMSTAFWQPFERWLEHARRGRRPASPARTRCTRARGGYRVEHAHGVRRGRPARARARRQRAQAAVRGQPRPARSPSCARASSSST